MAHPDQYYEYLPVALNIGPATLAKIAASIDRETALSNFIAKIQRMVSKRRTGIGLPSMGAVGSPKWQDKAREEIRRLVASKP